MEEKKYVICTLIKNEQAYIEEWVNYHLGLGITKIYLYEDFDSTSHEDVLKPYIDAGTVALTPLKGNDFGIKRGSFVHKVDGKTTQMMLFDWFVDKAKTDNIADWIAFIDIDEFLVFKDNYNLQKLTDELAEYPGIMLSYKLYGANGHIEKPEGGVLENYTQEAPEGVVTDTPRWNHKTIVNVALVEGTTNVHDWVGCVCTDLNRDFRHTTYVKAYIAHYYTKSFEEYKERMSRGNMGNTRRSFDQFFDLSPELKDREDELLELVRYDSCGWDVPYISRRKELTAGGNKKIVERLRKEAAERYANSN